MISIDTWSPWIAIIVAGIPILLSCVGIGFSVYLSRRYLDAMMVALRNSRSISIWGPSLRNQGWYGRVMLIAKIAGMVTWPQANIRIGDLDSVDIENFPPHLKRLLIMNLVTIFAALIWAVIVCVLLEFR
jgi:hypothetical protein